MYIISLSVGCFEYYLTISFSSTLTVLYLNLDLNLLLDNLKVPRNTTLPKCPCLLLYYMFMKKLLSIKQKAFTFKHSLNRGIYSSSSEINMQNSVIQALLTHMFNNRMCDLQLHANHFSIIWSLLEL